MVQFPPALTPPRCLSTAAQLVRSAHRAGHPAARAGMARLALDWIRLARELEAAPAA